MSQNSGRKMPRMNMTQWPLLIVMTPRVIARMSHRMPKPPPIQYPTTFTSRLSSPLITETRVNGLMITQGRYPVHITDGLDGHYDDCRECFRAYLAPANNRPPTTVT